MDMEQERKGKYIEELKRCAEEDCDFYLEHNEANELYNYIQDLQEELYHSKHDNEFYLSQIDLVKAVLNKSGFVRQTLTEDDIKNCKVEFIVAHHENGEIEFYRQMELGEFDE